MIPPALPLPLRVALEAVLGMNGGGGGIELERVTRLFRAARDGERLLKHLIERIANASPDGKPSPLSALTSVVDATPDASSPEALAQSLLVAMMFQTLASIVATAVATLACGALVAVAFGIWRCVGWARARPVACKPIAPGEVCAICLQPLEEDVCGADDDDDAADNDVACDLGGGPASPTGGGGSKLRRRRRWQRRWRQRILYDARGGTVHCKRQCGRSVHRACFLAYQAKRPDAPCVHCQAPWCW